MKLATAPASDALHVGDNHKAKKSPVQVKKPLEYLYAVFFLILILIIFIACRLFWKESLYTPEEGFGYYLGLVGGVIMLMAFVYGLRKHLPGLRALWSIQSWLNIHIIFGIAGPLMVMIHSTFHINSINGGLALISTVLVFLSGLAGRFLYRRVNYAIRGSRTHLQHLRGKIWMDEGQIKSRLPISASLERKLHRYTEFVTSAEAGMHRALFILLINMWRRNFLYRQICKQMKMHIKLARKRKKIDRKAAKRLTRKYKQLLHAYMFALSKMIDYVVFERLFSMWRLFHIPLLALLLTSGVVHVIAVHFY